MFITEFALSVLLLTLQVPSGLAGELLADAANDFDLVKQLSMTI